MSKPYFQLGGRKTKGGGTRSVLIISDKVKVKINVNWSEDKAQRYIAATMKNEIQAGIRAISIEADPATLARRASTSQEIASLGALAFKAFGAKRKPKKRKHLGQGKWGNDTGRLADGMRMKAFQESPGVAVFMNNAPDDRLNQSDFGGSSSYSEFRDKLIAYVPVLAKPQLLWEMPRVQAAIKKANASMIKIERVRK